MPWSAFWDRNYFAGAIPALRELMTNNFVRGAVSGLGVLNLFAALAELADMFSARQGEARLPADDDRSPSS
jgi:hypothetical protein